MQPISLSEAHNMAEDVDVPSTEKNSDQREQGGSQSTSNHPSPERDVVDQDPGERQKRNQDTKDDPLAA